MITLAVSVPISFLLIILLLFSFYIENIGCWLYYDFDYAAEIRTYEIEK